MPNQPVTTRRAALATIFWGMVLGTVLLGAGGRIAMRVIAEVTTGAGGFSLGGTTTVVFLGLVSGAVGGVVLWIARKLVGKWRGATSIIFWAVLLALTLRGLRPLDQLRVVLFLPLVAVFGALLQWRTWRYRSIA